MLACLGDLGHEGAEGIEPFTELLPSLPLSHQSEMESPLCSPYCFTCDEDDVDLRLGKEIGGFIMSSESMESAETSKRTLLFLSCCSSAAVGHTTPNPKEKGHQSMGGGDGSPFACCRAFGGGGSSIFFRNLPIGLLGIGARNFGGFRLSFPMRNGKVFPLWRKMKKKISSSLPTSAAAKIPDGEGVQGANLQATAPP
ncbi:hypothetical protein AMTR_s00100p00145420 [Amborella trichopoda]|uniref:Uncharacterized protein n=1 Tax=Amborella trichopoda TaxID=13333 RepID=W1NYS7_AMBTC|nr:hypothetical protein AMTR_s00100p00145420 [Amborella trichopoda]